MKQKLPRTQFNAPLLENYNKWGDHFLGFYDPMRGSIAEIEARFCEQAVDFFLEIAQSLPHSAAESEETEIYAREDRRRVRSHLRRERSRFLATQCKERDKFRCQVCRMTFAAIYGKLGHRFAEAHHTVPLAQLSDRVKTKLEDLITVCANCHRMLHRMDGKAGDVAKLQTFLRKHRKNP